MEGRTVPISQSGLQVAEARAVDALIRYRAIIAKLGEKDQQRWWDSNILNDDGGLFIAARLFPRTRDWAALELAIETAAIVHLERMNGRKGLTLFHTTPALERAVALRFRELKREHPDPRVVVPPIVFGSAKIVIEASLRDVLGAHLGEGPWREAVPQAGLLQVGSMTGDPSTQRVLDEFVPQLVSAYCKSATGDLSVPYYATTVGGDAR